MHQASLSALGGHKMAGRDPVLQPKAISQGPGLHSNLRVVSAAQASLLHGALLSHYSPDVLGRDLTVDLSALPLVSLQFIPPATLVWPVFLSPRSGHASVHAMGHASRCSRTTQYRH
jgi:hypothetical protein